MDKEPKSLWTKSWKGPCASLFWILIVSIAAFLGAFMVTVTASVSTPLFYRHPGFKGFATCLLIIMVVFIIAIAVAFVFFEFVRHLCSRRNFKRFIFMCACFATLIALGYAEEDWRGKYDWEQFKRPWEAKGEKFDFTDVIPPPVPDDQNFAMSPVFIAQEKYTFLNTPKRAEAWYGDRIYRDDVSKYFRLLPCSVSALVGTNWSDHSQPSTPNVWGNWSLAGLTDLKPWQYYYRSVEKTNPAANITITPQPQSPAADVLLALSKFDPLIDRLRQDSQLPSSRFPLQYDTETPAAILLPHLSALRQWEGVLELRSLAELQNGQSDKALEDVKLIFRMVDSVRTEPFFISHLVRIRELTQNALQPIYEGLAQHQWSDAQLADLDSELSGLNFVADYKKAARGEMAAVMADVDYVHHHPTQMPMWLEMGGSRNNLPPIAGLLVPNGWFYQNDLYYARRMEESYIPLGEEDPGTFSPTMLYRADNLESAETRKASPFKTVEKYMFEKNNWLSFDDAVKRFACGQSSVVLARVAVALERYRLAHGGYPESLDALAPAFMGQVPPDVINGGPLHYRPTSDGQFILYSVGWNERDDGGVIVFNKKDNGEDLTSADLNQGDWVWRYPAKPNE